MAQVNNENAVKTTEKLLETVLETVLEKSTEKTKEKKTAHSTEKSSLSSSTQSLPEQAKASLSRNLSFTFIPRRKFRILSLDGGGVRAMIQCRLLLRIHEMYPQFLNSIDLITGTSAGSIVGMALANNISPDEVSSWFEKEAPLIFSETYTREITSLGNLISAQFNAGELKKILQDQLGTKTLDDINQFRVLIPAFNLQPQFQQSGELPLSPCRVPHHHPISKEPPPEGLHVIESSIPSVEKIREEFSHLGFNDFENRWKPEFLHNFPSSSNSSTLIVDAVLRSTAAPTYFPIYQGYVDGGTFANNPSLAAVTTSIHHGIPLEDIVVLSLGTGFSPSSLASTAYGKGDWGVYQWAPYLIGMLLDANTEATTYQSQILLSERFFRINPVLSREIGLGDASSLPELKKIGDDFNLDQTKTWLEEVWEINDSLNYEQEEPQKGLCSIQ